MVVCVSFFFVLSAWARFFRSRFLLRSRVISCLVFSRIFIFWFLSLRFIYWKFFSVCIVYMFFLYCCDIRFELVLMRYFISVMVCGVRGISG